MHRYWHHSEPWASEHHDPSGVAAGQFFQELRVTGMAEARSVECFLLDRVRHHGSCAPATGEVDRAHDRRNDRARIRGVRAAHEHRMREPARQHAERLVKASGSFLGARHRAERHGPPQHGREPRKPVGVIDDEERWDTLRPTEPRHERDLTADARGLAHREGDRLRHTRKST